MDREFLLNHLCFVKKQLALFDFDGTITNVDTLPTFIRFYQGNIKFLLGLMVLSPIILLHFIKLIPNWRAKEILLAWFFKGVDVDVFNERCRSFTKEINGHVRKKALEEIRRHTLAGATIVVVSASPENWVKPWCDQHGIPCVATKLEVINNLLTGKINGRNCYGLEKETRIKKELTLKAYDEISAYGDSSGDREMLALAHHKFYKPFRS